MNRKFFVCCLRFFFHCGIFGGLLSKWRFCVFLPFFVGEIAHFLMELMFDGEMIVNQSGELVFRFNGKMEG